MLRFAATTIALILAAGLACDSGDKKPDRADIKPVDAKDGKAAPTTKEVEAPPGKVWFVTPKDGATVPTKLEVEMMVEGKTIRPAGATERDPLFGHHHVIIDGGPIPDMKIVAKDETNLHYGAGETKVTLLLDPGKHTLTMQFADGAHRSYGPDWASTITVNVVDGPAAGDAAAAADAAPDDEKADG